MLVTTNTSVTIPTSPGRSYQCAGLGTWGGATITLESFVDGAWRAVPDGTFTANFEIVRVNNAGTEMRAVSTGTTGPTALSVSLTETIL